MDRALTNLLPGNCKFLLSAAFTINIFPTCWYFSFNSTYSTEVLFSSYLLILLSWGCLVMYFFNGVSACFVLLVDVISSETFLGLAWFFRITGSSVAYPRIEARHNILYIFLWLSQDQEMWLKQLIWY